MKHFIDIHTLLSTAEDMEDLHDDPYEASDKLNTVLHLVYDKVEDDISSSELEKIIAFTWEHWHQDRHLLEIEVDDLVDWVDHLLLTWGDSDDHTTDEH